MKNLGLTVTGVCVMISWWASVAPAQEEEETECSHDAVVMAMTTCQGERQKLSYASQSNDTAQLCKALQNYSDCMKPRIRGCEGPAKTAFDVITTKYAGEPYNCKIKPKLELSDVDYKSNQANPGKDYLESVKTKSGTTKELAGDNELKDHAGKDNDDLDDNKVDDDEELDMEESVKPQKEQPYSIHSPEPSTAEPAGDDAATETSKKPKSTTATERTTKTAPDSKEFDPSDNGALRLAMTVTSTSTCLTLLCSFILSLRFFATL